MLYPFSSVPTFQYRESLPVNNALGRGRQQSVCGLAPIVKMLRRVTVNRVPMIILRSAPRDADLQYNVSLKGSSVIWLSKSKRRHASWLTNFEIQDTAHVDLYDLGSFVCTKVGAASFVHQLVMVNRTANVPFRV